MEWKPISKYDGLYLVSDDGKVFSTRTNKILKQGMRGEYRYVEINVNGVAKKEYVHRLVAEAFLPNPNNLPIVNHKDENPRNCNVNNLEWCTHKYNTNYGTCIERIIKNMPDKKGANSILSVPIYQYDLEGNLIAKHDGMREAARQTGLSSVSISKACNGKLKQYAGYVWTKEKKFAYDKEMKLNFHNGAILMYDTSGNLIRRFDDPRELKKEGFSQICCNRVCRGERKTYKGYVFKHEN